MASQRQTNNELLNPPNKRKEPDLKGTREPPRQSEKRARRGKEGAPARINEAEWPSYFQELYKVFIAMNTVLAFVSARKQLALSFSVVRSSIEGLLKRPLDVTNIAEIKALLPNMVRFAYFPPNYLEGHSEQTSQRRQPDFAAFAKSKLTQSSTSDSHVLVLEFIDMPRAKKPQPGTNIQAPVMLTPQAVKKLIEKRNERFRQAVGGLILASLPEGDPAGLLQAAGHDHIPINPETSGPFDKQARATITRPEQRASVETLLTRLQNQSWYKGQIQGRRTYEPQAPRLGELNRPLSEGILHAFKSARNIGSLYLHQAAAISAIVAGKHVVVSTSTASGKSVIYQAPLLSFLEASPQATAIFIYPTKALAQDQRLAMQQLLEHCLILQHIVVANYDGDTPRETRRGIRETASVILTNFDMIHASILPYEELWRAFLKNLKLVVVDELHYYSGLLGSHVSFIIRRLRRVCAALGNHDVQFVSCSATIANPQVQMHKIFGLELDDIEAITEDGAPAGEKHFLIWNPPLVDPESSNLRRHSSLSEAITLMEYLMINGIRVILFCKTRKVCELATKALRTNLNDHGRLDILERLEPYRGGYSQEDRRRIENDAFNGLLMGIIATNALELGVDIGVLDAVIMLGFPLNKASFWQQAGRAGRRARDSLIAFVAETFPIDQYYVNHPDELFDHKSDNIIIDLRNQVVLEAHLQCAAQEMPVCSSDSSYFGSMMQEICEANLKKDNDGWYHPHPNFLPYPSRYISIRGVLEERYVVVDITSHQECGETILEEVEISRAIFEIYEGGIFMHKGRAYLIKEISHDSKIARVCLTEANWITSPRDFTNIDAVQTHRIRQIQDSPHRSFYGRVDVHVKVFGFFKVLNGSILDVVDLDTPSWDQVSTGFWLDVPKNVLKYMQSIGINAAEAIHAAQHAFLNQFPLFEDLGTECKIAEKEYKATESKRKRPARLVFYDSIGKGGGVASKAFDHVSYLLRQAAQATEACPCTEGCTRCVQSTVCKAANAVSSKIGATALLKGLLGLDFEMDEEGIDLGPALFETIVEAEPIPTVPGIQIESQESSLADIIS